VANEKLYSQKLVTKYTQADPKRTKPLLRIIIKSY